MKTWKFPSLLSEKTRDELEKLRDAAIAFLRDETFHEEKCADKLGISMLQLCELKSRFPEDFQDLHERLRARFENIVYGAALGKIDPKSVHVATAKWWLERCTSDYQPSSRIKHENDGPERPKPNGAGRRLLSQYAQIEREEEDENGSILRREDLQ